MQDRKLIATEQICSGSEIDSTWSSTFDPSLANNRNPGLFKFYHEFSTSSSPEMNLSIEWLSTRNSLTRRRLGMRSIAKPLLIEWVEHCFHFSLYSFLCVTIRPRTGDCADRNGCWCERGHYRQGTQRHMFYFLFLPAGAYVLNNGIALFEDNATVVGCIAKCEWGGL